MTAVPPVAPATDDQDLSPWRRAGLEQRSRRRRLLLAELVAFVLVTVFFGFPTGREVLTFWMLLTLLAACAGNVQVWRRAVVRDWLPLLAVLFAYDLLRGIANEVGGAIFGLSSWQSSATNPAATAKGHLTSMIDADRWLFGGTVPTTWLQERFHTHGDTHWYDAVGSMVYMSHFMVSLGIAVTLWCVNYRVFQRYLVTLVTITLAALTTYVLYPAVPPWMASLNHPEGSTQAFLPYVHRIVDETLHAIGSGTVSSFVEQGAAYSNPVAAMPSLHAGIPMMMLLFFWPLLRTRGRAVLVAYALIMGVTLVYTGEHYVIDVLVGWLYAATVVGVLRWRWRRRTEPVAVESTP